MVQSYLAGQGVKTTTYWPQGPMVDTEGHGDADYIYSPCPVLYFRGARGRWKQSADRDVTQT